MNIAIYDPEHYEGIYPLIKLLSKPQNRLTIFTSSGSIDRLHEMLKSDFFNHKWITVEPENRSLKYFKRISSLIDVTRSDFVIFNTIASHHFFYAGIIQRLGPEKCLVTIHNLNNFFQSSPGIGLKSYLNNIGKKRLLKMVRYYNVINETLIPQLRHYLPAGKRVYNIPGGLFEQQFAPVPLSSPLTLVVPGMVDPQRRNYHQVLALSALAEQEKFPLKIILAGGMNNDYSRDLKNSIDTLQSQYTSIEYCDEPVVPQPKYDSLLARAHFIWVPSRIHFTLEKGLQEIYGVTKSSGNVFDIIRTAKPYLAPTALNMPLGMQPAGYHYQNISALLSYLQQVAQDQDKYEHLTATAQEVAREYSITAVSARMPDFLSSAHTAEVGNNTW